MLNASRRSTPTDKTIGAKVRARRLALGMSQESLAQSLGLTFQQVQKYESGKNRITASRLQQIASALRVEAASLLEGTETAPQQAGTQEAFNILTPEGVEFLLALREIKSPAVRRDLLRLVKSIAAGADQNSLFGGHARSAA